MHSVICLFICQEKVARITSQLPNFDYFYVTGKRNFKYSSKNQFLTTRNEERKLGAKAFVSASSPFVTSSFPQSPSSWTVAMLLQVAHKISKSIAVNRSSGNFTNLFWNEPNLSHILGSLKKGNQIQNKYSQKIWWLSI